MTGRSGGIRKLFASVAAFILGESPQVAITGNRDRVTATLRAAQASKALYEALSNPTTDMGRIKILLRSKRRAARNFKEKTGTKWLL
jgi:hypothetical protein